MSDDQFTKLFKYMEKRFDQAERRFDEQDKKIDTIYDILDAHLKKIELLLEENSVRDHQYQRRAVSARNCRENWSQTKLRLAT